MTRYAEATTVPATKSRAEVETTLERYGASAFAYGWATGSARVSFTIGGRDVAMTIPMPDPKDRAFTHTPTRGPRTATAAKDAYDQAVRQRWRAVALVIKAKLEAVAAGISTVEREFLADVVVGFDGRTVGDYAQPQIAEFYAQRELES